MTEICPRCGLPKDTLCMCEVIAKEDQKIKVKTVKRKFGKLMTVVEGINQKEIDVKDLTKNLKSQLACGGTAKEGVIELQGNHVNKVVEALVKLGFSKEGITKSR